MKLTADKVVTVAGFPYEGFDLTTKGRAPITYFPEGGYPKPYHRADPQDIAKTIHIGAMSFDNNSVDAMAKRTSSFIDHFYDRLAQNGGYGIGNKYDFYGHLRVDIVRKNDGNNTRYDVYVSGMYPRDRGNILSQIETKRGFDKSIKEAQKLVREELNEPDFKAKLAHTDIGRGSY